MNIPNYTGRGVYCITNKTNGKKYVGSSSNVKQRLTIHDVLLKHGDHSNKAMQRDYNGGDSFSCSVLYREPAHAMVSLAEMEREYIKELDTIKHGYNSEMP